MQERSGLPEYGILPNFQPVGFRGSGLVENKGIHTGFRAGNKEHDPHMISIEQNYPIFPTQNQWVKVPSGSPKPCILALNQRRGVNYWIWGSRFELGGLHRFVA